MKERYQTRGVLAGAYRGKNVDQRSLITHTCDTEDPDERSLCKRVKPGHLVDEYGMTQAQLSAPPTCPNCLTRDPRFKGTGMEPNADLEWIKGDGVDQDGHSLAWWKSRLKKWKGEYDRPRAELRVTCWDRRGKRADDRTFSIDDLSAAKAAAKAWSQSSGSAEVRARIEIPYQKTYLIDIGEYRSTGSNGYYVWTVDRDGVPYDRRGPWENPDEAIGHAKVGSRAGNKFDHVVTFGSDPAATDFEIIKAFKAWSGEVHYGTDLPRVGGRLREYR